MTTNQFSFLLFIFCTFFQAKTSLFAQELIIPQTHGDRIFSIAHSADEKYVATSSTGVVKVWDAKSGKELPTESPDNFIKKCF